VPGVPVRPEKRERGGAVVQPVGGFIHYFLVEPFQPAPRHLLHAVIGPASIPAMAPVVSASPPWFTVATTHSSKPVVLKK